MLNYHHDRNRAMMMIPVFNNISEYFDQLISLFSVGFILVEMKVEFWLSAVILIVLFGALVKSIKKQKISSSISCRTLMW